MAAGNTTERGWMLWHRLKREGKAKESKKDYGREARELESAWIKSGLLTVDRCVILALRFTCFECQCQGARLELLLTCEVMEGRYGYVSGSRLREYLPARLAMRVKELEERGYLKRTGMWNRPLALTRAGLNVCDTYRKHWRRLSNAAAGVKG